MNMKKKDASKTVRQLADQILPVLAQHQAETD